MKIRECYQVLLIWLINGSISLSSKQIQNNIQRWSFCRHFFISDTYIIRGDTIDDNNGNTTIIIIAQFSCLNVY